jgi:hypothetical protein
MTPSRVISRSLPSRDIGDEQRDITRREQKAGAVRFWTKSLVRSRFVSRLGVVRAPAGMATANAEPMSDVQRQPESGKAGYAIAWLLGIPLPILLVVYLISRC